MTVNRTNAGDTNGRNIEPVAKKSYSLLGRSSWAGKQQTVQKSNPLAEAEKRAEAIRERQHQNEQRYQKFESELKAMQDAHKEQQKQEERTRAGAHVGGFKARTDYSNKVMTWLRDTGGLKTMSSTQFDQLSKASKDVGKRETERLLREWWEAPNHLS